MTRNLWGVLATAVLIGSVVQVHTVSARSRAVAAPAAHARALALPCQATNVTAALAWQTTSGALIGKLTFLNRSASSCTLAGRPTILLLANGTQVLPVAVTLPVSIITHFGIGNVIPVTLAPHDSAAVSVQWYNWCGAHPRMLSLVYALPAGGGGYALPVSSSGHNAGVLLPRCDNQVLPSHLDVGLFQHP